MGAAVANLFDRLNEKQPSAKKTPKDDNSAKSQAQNMLDWLQRWNKPTVCLQDICQYGPHRIRNRRIALDTAGILVGAGWLVPIETRLPNSGKRRFEWQIVRRPIVYPAVARKGIDNAPGFTKF
jgi:hypothetical protein